MGNRWRDFGSDVVIVFSYCFLWVIESALTAMGKVKAIFMFDVISLAVIVGTLLTYLQVYDDLNNMLWFRVLIGLASNLLMAIALHIVVPLKCIQIVGALILSAVMSGISIVFTE